MASRSRITVGIDGGGSGCRVALRLPGGGVLRGEGGPANAFTDPAQAAAEITGTVGAALDRAGLSWAAMKRARVCAGISGCRLPDLATEMTNRLPFPTAIVDDSVTALRGALGTEDGTLVSLGTGSFFARRVGSDTRHLGGWGFTLGDEASGAWMGRHAVSLSLQALEGRLAADALSDAILAHLPTHPLLALQGARPSQFAALAPLIFAHASTGIARRLIDEAVSEVMRALRDLGHVLGEPVVLTGGVATQLAAYLPQEIRTSVVAAKGTPLDGALALAETQP